MVEVDFEEICRIEQAKSELRDKIKRQNTELQAKRAHLEKLEESEELLLGLRLTAPLRRIRSALKRKGARG